MTSETVLDRIVASKRVRLEAAKERLPLSALGDLALNGPPPRGFLGAIEGGGKAASGSEGPRTADARGGGPAVSQRPAVIAEIKKASPSAGIIHAELDMRGIARAYEAGGAAALSVLTEEDHFAGSIEDLKQVRRATMLPVMRKDFILETYQVFESRAAGADAVLLIVRLLEREDLGALLALAHNLGMDALVEVHDERELVAAVEAGARIVGVNNRDLATLKVDLGLAECLLPLVPDDIVKVAESGITTPEDLSRMGDAGADAVLVGESLLRQEDPGAALARLIGRAEPPPVTRPVFT